ncbi:L-fucose:H+ symporter permease [Tellurirhabdus bombi]|uniref:L-fucose:H+ symporter permease n=1 Tax=Tellurirhabdus bombi TaxID=2907205 RepID=UPI001F224675|nr:L-fucose:H+ symporter permease [Tellurirhabdus bombi]
MASVPSSTTVKASNSTGSYALAFALVTSLFFLWAFVHNLEPILIPHLKKACQLTDLQSSLIDSAVYLGYFIMALPAGFVMKKYGYQRGIIIGLIMYAVGAFLFVPAADTRLYTFFLGALFIIASGCAFLETAANPYVTVLGNPETATTRLNFSQSFNGLGAFLAPVLGGKFILSGIEHSEAELAAMSPEALDSYLQYEASQVKLPYLIIGIVVVAVAVLFMLIKLPSISESQQKTKSSIQSALRHRHLKWGVIAQFFYIGAQVCVTSFFIRFAKFTSDIPEKDAAEWLGWAMLFFMIGRFVGTYLTRFISANKLLTIYSLISAFLLFIAMTVDSEIAVWAIFAVPFFESIMFATIFSLGIDKLGEDTELGSSLLVMAIAGGALFPVLMGYISDQSNIKIAYIVPLLCFFVVAYFGWKGYQPEVQTNSAD